MARIVQHRKDYTVSRHVSIYGQNAGFKDANSMTFNNENTTLQSTTVQGAIEELDNRRKEVYIVLDKDEWVKESDTSYIQTVPIIGIDEEDTITVSLYEGATDAEKLAYFAIDSIILKDNNIVFRSVSLPPVSIHIKAKTDCNNLYTNEMQNIINFIRNYESKFSFQIVDELPPETEFYRGKMVIYNVDGVDNLYICLRIKTGYRWVNITNPIFDLNVDVDDTGNATLSVKGYMGDQPITPPESEEPLEPEMIVDEHGDATFTNVGEPVVDSTGNLTFTGLKGVNVDASGNLTFII